MYKILVCITNYILDRAKMVNESIDEYMSLPYEIDTRVYTSHDEVYRQPVETIRTHSEGWYACWESRKDIVARVQDYDLFINTEDDIFVKRNTIEAFLELKLPPNYIPGFLSVEGNNTINLHASYSPAIDSYTEIDGKIYFTPLNLHSATYMATRQHMLTAIQSGQFDEYPRPTGRDYGVPEWSQTNIYVGCGMKKVIPIDDLDNFLIEHRGNKYTKILQERGPMCAIDELKLILTNRSLSL